MKLGEKKEKRLIVCVCRFQFFGINGDLSGGHNMVAQDHQAPPS